MPDAPTPPPALPAIEAIVMDEIWRQGGATVREILDALNAQPAAKHRAYTTVMTIMNRLLRKGLLRRRREGKRDLYTPVLARGEYQQARAKAQVGALVDEFGDLALVHFADQMARLDHRHREQLRRLARRDRG